MMKRHTFIPGGWAGGRPSPGACLACGQPPHGDRHIEPGWEVAGRKDDTGKVRLDLLPPELIYGVGTVLTFGAGKYGARNWEKGIAYSRVFGAAMRHAWAWWGGEAKDSETGFSHLWHLGCCVAFLIAMEERDIGPDDRPSK